MHPRLMRTIEFTIGTIAGPLPVGITEFTIDIIEGAE